METQKTSVALDNAHRERTEAVAARFRTDINSGLAASEAEARFKTLGPNDLPEAKASFWKLYIAPFIENWLVIIYLIAGVLLLVISLVIKKVDFSTFTFAFVVINAILAIFQQVRAQKALKALKQFTKDKCTVLRDGEKVEIDATNVVQGDVLVLQEGDKIPADSRLVSANNLFINEASITGESVPVEKDPAPIEKTDVSTPDLKNYVFMGSYVTKGNGRAIVVATGSRTEMGKVAGELTSIADQEIPLRKKINNFAKYLGILVCVMFTIICLYKLLLNSALPPSEQLPVLVVLRDAIIRAIQFMPINIILLVTVILFTGVLALAKRGVIVRNLSATDALGRISVLCTDKTGTLTQNEMTVKFVIAGGKLYDVSGSGYIPDGQVTIDGKPVVMETSPSLRSLITSGMLNGNAELVTESRMVAGGRKKVIATRKVIGDPVEAALHVLAEKTGMDKDQNLVKFVRAREYPFDSELKRMSIIYSPGEKEGAKWQLYTKGATELIVGLSSAYMTDGGPVPLESQQRDEILSDMERWSGKGYRTLGIAMREIDASVDAIKLSRDQIEKDLVFLGFVMIADPLRPGVKKAVESCESAGVKVVMITGDHPRTAKTIGSELGIWKAGDQIIEGSEIKALTDQPIDNVSIFARVDPREKDQIVRRYQGINNPPENGAKSSSPFTRIIRWLKNEKEEGAADRVVAMTGDGVNDALALGMADVGIAMGISGTAVAKEAADMIITDDSFNTIELGIREGRALFAKIRTIIYFFIYTNLIEASFLFATSFIPGFFLFHPGGPDPWLVDQVYLIVGLSHAVPPLGLTFDRTAYEIMTEKPRNEEEIFNKNTLLLMLVHMGILLLGFFMSFGLVYPVFASGGDLGRPRTIALGIVLSIEIFTIFSIRRPNLPVWRSFRRDLSPILLLFTVFAYGNFVVAVYIPLAGGLFFSLQPLSGTDWLLIILTGMGAVFGLELAKWLIKKYRGLF